MTLKGPQAKKLHDAILSGFSGSDLEQLVRLELDEQLDNIVRPGPLSAIVLELIQWADRQGRVNDLILAIQQARPNNTQVQAAAKALLAPAAAEPRPAAGTAALDGPRRARLRAVLLDQFPTRNVLAMLVDDSLSVNLDTVSTGTNLTEVVFALIQWASLDPK